jgi:hypothetical protein
MTFCYNYRAIETMIVSMALEGNGITNAFLSGPFVGQYCSRTGNHWVFFMDDDKNHIGLQ